MYLFISPSVSLSSISLSLCLYISITCVSLCLCISMSLALSLHLYHLFLSVSSVYISVFLHLYLSMSISITYLCIYLYHLSLYIAISTFCLSYWKIIRSWSVTGRKATQEHSESSKGDLRDTCAADRLTGFPVLARAADLRLVSLRRHHWVRELPSNLDPEKRRNSSPRKLTPKRPKLLSRHRQWPPPFPSRAPCLPVTLPHPGSAQPPGS